MSPVTKVVVHQIWTGRCVPAGYQHLGSICYKGLMLHFFLSGDNQ